MNPFICMKNNYIQLYNFCCLVLFKCSMSLSTRSAYLQAEIFSHSCIISEVSMGRVHIWSTVFTVGTLVVLLYESCGFNSSFLCHMFIGSWTFVHSYPTLWRAQVCQIKLKIFKSERGMNTFSLFLSYNSYYTDSI